MANRYMVRNYMTLEKGPVALYLKATIGAVGAPTISAINSKGFISIVRTGVGAYTLNLGSAVGVDTYQRLLMAMHVCIGASSTAVSMVVVQDNSANLAAPNVKVQFESATGAAPVELGNGEILLVKLDLSNSTAV